MSGVVLVGAVPQPRRVRVHEKLLAAAGPDVTLLALFLASLAILVSLFGASFVWTDGQILIPAGILVTLVSCRFLWRARTIVSGAAGERRRFGEALRGILRDWGPFIVLMWAFESLESYTGLIRTEAIDAKLYALDLSLFGVEPTVWMGRFANALLTDWMSFCYGLYF